MTWKRSITMWKKRSTSWKLPAQLTTTIWPDMARRQKSICGQQSMNCMRRSRRPREGGNALQLRDALQFVRRIGVVETGVSPLSTGGTSGDLRLRILFLGVHDMRITYDQNVDALYTRFNETTVTTKHLGEGI